MKQSTMQFDNTLKSQNNAVKSNVNFHDLSKVKKEA